MLSQVMHPALPCPPCARIPCCVNTQSALRWVTLCVQNCEGKAPRTDVRRRVEERAAGHLALQVGHKQGTFAFLSLESEGEDGSWPPVA